MGEMNEHREQEKKGEDLKRTINSDCYFSFSMRPTKLAEPKKEEPKKDEDIKLFDFGS